jgi:hypothetical protein
MINASILSSLDTLTSYLSGEKKKGLLSSLADNSTSRLESLLSISPASAKPGKKYALDNICINQETVLLKMSIMSSSDLEWKKNQGPQR